MNSDAEKAWASLVTKSSYLPGLFTLDYSLKRVGSKFPLIALYTDALPKDGHQALDIRDTWTKLSVFGISGFERVVLLDADMIVRQNMDELMDIPLDNAGMKGQGNRVFAASHACACNPLKKEHYPKTWIPENCAFTSQHDDPERAQIEGAPSSAGVAMLNSGLLVVIPSPYVHEKIREAMLDEGIANYNFPDQELLSEAFKGRWVPLPYIYNALKTLRAPEVHGKIWRDDKVKIVHYILSPKPWEIKSRDDVVEETVSWWWDMNDERVREEKKLGIVDEFQ
ncbi:hypothetical protein, variant [Verruconis gallopava]|uniref:Nucleotide-diphospho-sugar transferase n=1 Tax=Verruconis gallopava TaxID=253628 RepID=A0A0D2AKA9_9PEZI|nr:hypothetical protein, variant [Verruconis gallopava]KIV99413.1 hypothetical protein, variant [Verruconis gallopava]